VAGVAGVMPVAVSERESGNIFWITFDPVFESAAPKAKGETNDAVSFVAAGSTNFFGSPLISDGPMTECLVHSSYSLDARKPLH